MLLTVYSIKQHFLLKAYAKVFFQEKGDNVSERQVFVT